MSLMIKKGDRVIVTAGRSKGKTGKVLKLIAGKKRIVVEGVNLVKKHVRKRSESEPGGIREIPAALDISNVAILCPACNKKTRFAVTIATDKTKTRICKKCQKPI